jgi:hypothetical protein
MEQHKANQTNIETVNEGKSSEERGLHERSAWRHPEFFDDEYTHSTNN